MVIPSGGAWLFIGHPDKLLWCEYKPVTWPVPSQPGVGHFTSKIKIIHLKRVGHLIGRKWEIFYQYDPSKFYK